MDKADARVLKAAEIRVDGQFNFDIGETKVSQPCSKNNSVQAQVCIIEKTPKYATLEVTCSCGIKTCVRCDYE